MSKTNKDDKIQVNFKVNSEQWQRFKAKCQDRGTSAAAVLNEAIATYLKEETGSDRSDLPATSENTAEDSIDEYIRNKIDKYLEDFMATELREAMELYFNSHLEECLGKVLKSKLETGNKFKNGKVDVDGDSSFSGKPKPRKEPKICQIRNEGDRELKTAKELAESLSCSTAYINTLNRLGELKQRGWKDSGKKLGKAILYQRTES